MSQQLIVTTPINSGLGDPAPTAFGKVNANFTELYQRSPFLSVVSFGADPTGTNDSTIAINNTISAQSVLGGGMVLFPPGAYKCGSSITLLSFVTLLGYGATLNSSAAIPVATATAGVTQEAGILGLSINGGSTATTMLSLLSTYQCVFRDLRFLSTSTTNFVVAMGVNTTGVTNPDGNYNNVFNRLDNFLQDGTCGTFIQLKGLAGTPTVVTLNSFSGMNCRGGCAVRGIEFNSWCDSNYFGEVTRIQLQAIASGTACGVEWNSGSPTSNVGVYANNFSHLAVDNFGSPSGDARVGIRQGWTKSNKVEYYFNEPQAASGAIVLDATNTQSYYVNQVVGGSSSTILHTKLWYIGGADNAIQTISGGGDVSTQTVGLEIGLNRTGSGFAYLDLIGDTTFNAYGTRLIRSNAGANANSQLLHRGTGNLVVFAQDSGGQVVLQDSVGARLTVGGGGISFFGNGTQTQSTGWGTPTGGGVISNFPGSAATAAQSGQVLSTLITYFKSLGLLAT